MGIEGQDREEHTRINDFTRRRVYLIRVYLLSRPMPHTFHPGCGGNQTMSAQKHMSKEPQGQQKCGRFDETRRNSRIGQGRVFLEPYLR